MGDKKWVQYCPSQWEWELRESCVEFGCGRRGLVRLPDSAVSRERSETETEIVGQVLDAERS